MNDKHLTTLKEMRSTKATDEQIAVVEKMPIDEAITILEASLFSNWEGRDGQLPIAIRTALDELKTLREQEEQEREFICRKCGLRQELGKKSEVTF